MFRFTLRLLFVSAFNISNGSVKSEPPRYNFLTCFLMLLRFSRFKKYLLLFSPCSCHLALARATIPSSPREDLSWNEHIKNIVNKTNQRLGLLRRIKTLLPLNARLILYHSLILPLFDYGDIIWGDKNNTLLMNDLQVQQNKAAKLILDRPKYSSATEALEELEWKHLDHRRHLHRCVFIFRCLHNIIDFNFNFRQNNDIHHHNTRQSKNLHLSAPKTNWAKQKLTYQAALDFNLLSPEIQETASILLFKKKLERIS